jgi:hypothetical protein
VLWYVFFLVIVVIVDRNDGLADCHQNRLAGPSAHNINHTLSKQTYLGAAGAALALIISSPFSAQDAPSFSLPTISLPAGSTKAPATAAAPPSAVKKIEKKVKKLKSTSPYDFSLEEEVKLEEKEVKKDLEAEKKASAQAKKDEIAAEKAAEKEAAAIDAEKKVGSPGRIHH